MTEPQTAPACHISPIGPLAHYIRQAGPAERAALARMTGAGPASANQLAALSRALFHARLRPALWRPETWRLWAAVANGIAIAGHDGSRPLGSQMAAADVSESRVTRLLSSSGLVFRNHLRPFLRLMAGRSTMPNWFELAPLVLRGLRDPVSDDDVNHLQKLRLKIASSYFAARATTPR